jgi:hypothetical protein
LLTQEALKTAVSSFVGLAAALLTAVPTMTDAEIEILTREREWAAIERCAKLAESFKGWIDKPDDMATAIARAIRALWRPKRRLRRSPNGR